MGLRDAPAESRAAASQGHGGGGGGIPAPPIGIGTNIVTEQELLLDCVRRLNASGVHYMLTGSMASNAWGIPRTTHDLDFVIQLPPSQIPALVKAFDDLYYFSLPP